MSDPQSSGSSDRSSEKQRLRPSGGYRDLRSFQTTTLIYDGTVAFCARFVDSRSRTTDQMVQAARSGRQNIAEGSRAAATSSQTELRLVNVARASLEELLIDYQDFLRVRDLPAWAKDSAEALYIRKLGKQPDESYETYRTFADTRPADTLANIALCLIHQANYLLDQQLRALEKDFLNQGGLRERMFKARLAHRNQLPKK